ncbi:MAG: DHH family phosphoesterase [Clostridia bacterium]|nr:DHH family phosphoesterase [Clostridia bacterium]
MKKLWKRFDVSLISFFLSFLFVIISGYFNIYLALTEFLVLCGLIAFKTLYIKKTKEKMVYQANQISHLLDYENGKAFNDLTVACCVIQEEGNILWFNNSFKNSFEISDETSTNDIKTILKKNKIDKILEGRGFRLKVDSKYFSVYSSEIETEDGKLFLLYFFDETKLRLTEKEYYDSRPSIMLTVIDNADEIYQNFKESECAAIFSKLEQLIDSWANSYGALCRKYSNARMMIFAEERAIQKMIADKFSILEKIREFTYEEKSADVTLSIGVGKEASLEDSNNSAKQALDMAQSRGGDQVAIKHQAQYKFYGGVSQGVEKRNKVKTRLIAKSISDSIKNSDNVLIMGHRFSDFDAFGAAVGVYSIAKHFSVPAAIVIDKKTTLAGPIVEKYDSITEEKMFISPESSLSLVHENTLLVVVDTHKKDFTECPGLVDAVEKIIVIDHHRKSIGYIENTSLFFHSPNASSTCEMVTELVQYVDVKPFIDSLCAQALFAGIMLDTRNFVIRTGVRTFEAAAYLRSRAANTVEAKKLFSNDMDIFRMRNSVIDNAEKYREQCAISVVENDSKDIRLITSQAADEMLNIEGIKASFVLYNNGDEVNISARSFGEINVQLIMEMLGGGGHQAMSACQLKNTDLTKSKQKLISAIDKYLDS